MNNYKKCSDFGMDKDVMDKDINVIVVSLAPFYVGFHLTIYTT